jgi:hypothetical protein
MTRRGRPTLFAPIEVWVPRSWERPMADALTRLRSSSLRGPGGGPSRRDQALRELVVEGFDHLDRLSVAVELSDLVVGMQRERIRLHVGDIERFEEAARDPQKRFGLQPCPRLSSQRLILAALWHGLRLKVGPLPPRVLGFWWGAWDGVRDDLPAYYLPPNRPAPEPPRPEAVEERATFVSTPISIPSSWLEEADVATIEDWLHDGARKLTTDVLRRAERVSWTAGELAKRQARVLSDAFARIEDLRREAESDGRRIVPLAAALRQAIRIGSEGALA